MLAGLSETLFVERRRSDFFVPIVLRSLCLKPGSVLSLRDPASPCPLASDIYARDFFEVTHRGSFLRGYNQTQLHRAHPCKQAANALDCEAMYVAALTRRRHEDALVPLNRPGGLHLRLLVQAGLVQTNGSLLAARRKTRPGGSFRRGREEARQINKKEDRRARGKAFR